MILILLLVAGLLAAAVYLFMQQPVFGKNPEGKRLERIEKSPNYRNGAFQNIEKTEVMREGASYWGMIGDMLNKPADNVPPAPLPSVKTDVKTLPEGQTSLVWFGHSSYFIQSKGIKVLVDPVFSGNASPVSFFGAAYPGSNVYAAEDFPAIDVCIITHDHYDHLDYPTILKLKDKVQYFYTALGVGAHLEHWGVAPDKIIELDWWESSKHPALPLQLTATPARHFSGRGFTRAKTLWASFVLHINGLKLFLGGDSGFGQHFKTIGDQYGPFDFALLECGQYGKDWPQIHMLPEEVAMAATGLQTKILMPVHWAKFSLAMHSWTEPVERLLKKAPETQNLQITTPMIGEIVVIDGLLPQKKWWK